jgi:CRISPR/Cas system type I-B associated protein Csh2 (Cas7 group RAMP superfamily)
MKRKWIKIETIGKVYVYLFRLIEITLKTHLQLRKGTSVFTCGISSIFYIVFLF